MDTKNVIREKRLELGLTYEELGKMIGVGKSTVRKWEIGMIENIRRDNIVALAKALKISPALIMGWNIKDFNKEPEKFTKEETKMLLFYNKLNTIGKHEAIKRVEELAHVNKYIEKDYLIPIAAHDKEDINVTDKDLKNDIDIMMDNNEW